MLIPHDTAGERRAGGGGGEGAPSPAHVLTRVGAPSRTPHPSPGWCGAAGGSQKGINKQVSPHTQPSTPLWGPARDGWCVARGQEPSVGCA